MATRKSPAFSIDDAVEDSIWIRAQLMDWRLAVWMAASLHPWESRGHPTPSHRLPAPAPIVFAAEQPYQMLWGPSWRAGSDTECCPPVDVILPPATSLPLLSSVSQSILHLLRPSTVQLCQRSRPEESGFLRPNTKPEFPRSPQQSPPVNVGRADRQSPSADSDDKSRLQLANHTRGEGADQINLECNAMHTSSSPS